jgi:hypothetical protein
VRNAISFVCGTALASCAQPSAHDDERSNNPAPEIAVSVERCGLNLNKVTFVETKKERYLTFERHPVLNKSGMACLAKVLVSAEYGLRTGDKAFDRSYTSAWQSEHSIYVRNLASEWVATNKPSLVIPLFSGVEGDLPGFVAGVERLCDAPTGTALVTDPSNVYLPWLQEPADEANCIFYVLAASNLNEHGIEVGLGGVP